MSAAAALRDRNVFCGKFCGKIYGKLCGKIHGKVEAPNRADAGNR